MDVRSHVTSFNQSECFISTQHSCATLKFVYGIDSRYITSARTRCIQIFRVLVRHPSFEKLEKYLAVLFFNYLHAHFVPFLILKLLKLLVLPLHYTYLPTNLPVWPDWAIYLTLGKFLKPLATINLPKSPTFLGQFL